MQVRFEIKGDDDYINVTHAKKVSYKLSEYNVAACERN